MSGFNAPRAISDSLLTHMGLGPRQKISLADITRFFSVYERIKSQGDTSIIIEVENDIRLTFNLSQDVQFITYNALPKYILRSVLKDFNESEYRNVPTEIVSAIRSISDRSREKGADFEALKNEWNKLSLRPFSPWGKFNINNFKYFPLNVRNEIRTFLLCWKRLEQSRDLRMMIVSYIATKR